MRRLVAIVAVTAVLVTAGVVQLARAQDSTIFVDHIVKVTVTPSNGFFSVDPNNTIGFSAKAVPLRDAVCSGTSPRSGSGVPAQVVCSVSNGVVKGRVLGPRGTPLNTPVVLSISYDGGF